VTIYPKRGSDKFSRPLPDGTKNRVYYTGGRYRGKPVPAGKGPIGRRRKAFME